MPIDVLDDKGKSEYQTKIFTNEGYTTLYNYASQLIRILNAKNNKYPFTLGILLGIPMMDYARVIQSTDELKIRIKSYMHILGIKEITTKTLNGSIVTFKVGD